MASQAWNRERMLALTAASAIGAAFWIDTARASQGPGGGLGTASNLTQLVTAVIVWGTAALVVCAGLIGALRR